LLTFQFDLFSRLSELLQEVAPGEVLDKDVEEFLQQHIDEFVDSVTEYACQLAKHRKSRTLDARDVQLYLEKNWNIRVPGYGDDPRPARKLTGNPAQSAHAARLQAIAKSQQNNS
jgi:transcription initiation factor TFIID subunit 12